MPSNPPEVPRALQSHLRYPAGEYIDILFSPDFITSMKRKGQEEWLQSLLNGGEDVALQDNAKDCRSTAAVLLLQRHLSLSQEDERMHATVWA